MPAALPSWLTPLYDAAGMREIDRRAIEWCGVPSLRLMEAAGRAVAEAVVELGPERPVRVICGKGNNGGDGLVAARLLEAMGFAVEVLLLWPAAELSADARANLERLGPGGDGEERPRGPGSASVAILSAAGADLAARLDGSGAVVDAIFGTGFSGAPRDPAAGAIDAVNRCGAPVVACDIASGVDASSGEVAGAAIEATVTVAFHAAKVGHLLAPGKWRAGELRLAPIGIPGDCVAGPAGSGPPAPVAAVVPAAGVIAPAVLSLAPRRGPRSTKFSSGRVTVAGASRGLTGAVQLCSLAAIRAGAGYATVAVPAGLEPIFEAGRPEVMSRGCPADREHLSPASADAVLGAFEGAAAGVLGPGLGRAPASHDLVRGVLARIAAPLVLDADGLNACAGGLEAVAARSAPTVLTPHAGELGRLLGRPSEEIGAHRLACAREAACAAAAIVVLKGDDTIVTDGERVAVNAVSSPALATAGTGDVLAGILAALMARGMAPFDAACAAVLAHARAGLEAARRIGAAESVIAGDVVEALPLALRPGRLPGIAAGGGGDPGAPGDLAPPPATPPRPEATPPRPEATPPPPEAT